MDTFPRTWTDLILKSDLTQTTNQQYSRNGFNFEVKIMNKRYINLEEELSEQGVNNNASHCISGDNVTEQWYKTNRELFSSEISQVLSVYKCTKFAYLDNGNMTWNITVGIKPNDEKRIWKFKVVYDKNYDGNNENSVKVYSISPTYEEIKQRLFNKYGEFDNIPYTRTDSNGNKYISYYKNYKTPLNAVEKLKAAFKWGLFVEKSLMDLENWQTFWNLYQNDDAEGMYRNLDKCENANQAIDNQTASEQNQPSSSNQQIVYDENENVNNWIKKYPDERKKEIDYLKKNKTGYSYQINAEGVLTVPFSLGEFVFLMVIDKDFPNRTVQGFPPVKVYLVKPTAKEIKEKFNMNCVPNVKMDSNGYEYITLSEISNDFERYISGKTEQTFVEIVIENTSKWFREISNAIYENPINQRPDLYDGDEYSCYSGKKKKYCDARASRDNPVNTRCKKVVLSDRAYAQILSETFNRVRTETGGLLLGHFDDGVWYVVEASDPGINAVFSAAYHEGDEDYENHVCGVYSRLYKHPLVFLGMWHRHPGSMDTFSGTDDQTNYKFAGSCGNGCISALINIDPNFRITFYYVEQGKHNQVHYSKVDVEVGDDKFENKNVLKFASTSDVVNRLRGGR